MMRGGNKFGDFGGSGSKRLLSLLVAAVMLGAVLVAPTAAAEPDDPEDGGSIAAEDPSTFAPDPGFVAAAGFPNWAYVATIGAGVASDGVRDVQFDSTGKLWASYHLAHELVQLNLDGSPTGLSINEALDDARGFVITDTGFIYIADTGDDEIVVARVSDGVVTNRWGASGSGVGQFNRPCDVVISPDNNRVYVADTYNDRIQIFDINGIYVGQFGSLGIGNGEFIPVCSGFSLAAYGDEIFVTDPANDRVQVFDVDGNFRRLWGSTGNGNGQFRSPAGVTAHDGYIWVTDRLRDDIQAFTIGGLYEGTIPGVQTAWAYSPAIDPAGDAMWVGGDDGIWSYSTNLCDGTALTAVGSSWGDNMAGTSGQDVVHLGAGNDRYNGFADDDLACGGAGNDTIKGGPGHDNLRGQGGDDTLAGQGGADTLLGGPGEDDLKGAGGPDFLSGGPDDDKASGQGAADTVLGGPGDDTLDGQQGADILIGGPGNDLARGQIGPDTLEGHDGDDELLGGNGNDTFFGGAGFDKCAGNLGPADSAETGTCEQTPGVEAFF